MSRTIQQLAQESLQVQDACNLSGVVHGFSRAMTDLCELKIQCRRNTHPICVLWADKIAHLTETQTLGHDSVSAAYEWAHRQIASETMMEIERPASV